MSTATAPGSTTELLTLYRKSGLYDEAPFRRHYANDDELPADPRECAAALVQAGLLTNFQAKQLLSGRHRGFTLGVYRILEPIGQGGMGVVFLGEHMSLKRRVAIKVLPVEKAKDKLSLERFYREARAAAALSHPNIVGLYDVSQGGGVHFLAMEYVEGTDLQALMAKTGPLHHAQAASYVAQAAAGLSHAHSKGIVHRDIKPGNLILAKDGTIKLLDLGLARSLSNEADALTGLLGDGEVAGTADYIAPEQALGQPSDERGDIYSLGATLYALVAGHPPFAGSTTQKLMQHQLKDPPSLTKKLAGRVPPALAQVVTKMMAKRPADRYQTPEDVIDALGPWLPAPTTGNVVGEEQTPAHTKSVRPRRRPADPAPAAGDAPRRGVPKWAWGAGAGVVMFTVAVGAAWLFTGDSRPKVVAAVTPPATPAVAATPAATPPDAPKPEKAAAKPRPAAPAREFPRKPLAAEPGDAKFVRVSLDGVVNVSSDRLLFHTKFKDFLVLTDWSDRRVEGVPFRLTPPQGDEPNVLEFYGKRGLANDLPKAVTVPVGTAAAQLHFLSGVSAWGFPCDNAGALGDLVLTVVIHYEGGRTEDHRWENGVHFCDYIGNHDVPQSKHAITFAERRTVRYLTIAPASDAVIREVEFVRNAEDESVPILLAMTVEKRAGGKTSAPARPESKPEAKPAAPAADTQSLIPLDVPAAPNQPAAPAKVAAGPVTAGGVTFARRGDAPGVVLTNGASATVNCFLVPKAVYILGAAAAEPAGGTLKVRLNYAGGQTEDHEWKPEAGATPTLRTVTPKRPGVVQTIGFENPGPATVQVIALAVEPV